MSTVTKKREHRTDEQFFSQIDTTETHRGIIFNCDCFSLHWLCRDFLKWFMIAIKWVIIIIINCNLCSLVWEWVLNQSQWISSYSETSITERWESHKKTSEKCWSNKKTVKTHLFRFLNFDKLDVSHDLQIVYENQDNPVTRISQHIIHAQSMVRRS